ncbi:MAG: hypothetical protein K6E75_12010 [Lachnospiraceae bacterium]|nr:hypothetical protein [Lachnospiraceae bacterium]
MELFMDRYGGIITIVLGGLLAILATLFFLNDSKLSKRIAYLEGCCEQVQERLENTTGADEEMIRTLVRDEIEALSVQQKESITGEIETQTQTLKEEIREEIEAEVLESVKAQIEEGRKSTSKTTGKSSTSKTNTSQNSTSTTVISSESSTQTMHKSTSEPAEDPDDKHFVVGSGDDEEED